MKRKNKIILLSTIIFLILITLILITYGYYLTNINGNTNDKSVTASIAYLELTYNDGNGLISANNIIPGENITTKTFSVENTGNKKVVNYVVYLEDVINTFEDKNDLKLTLNCTSSINSNCMGNNTIYPDKDTLLVLNDIEVGEIQTYELKVDFIETYDDQSDNMNKIIEGNIVIKDLKGTENSLEIVSGTDNVMLDNPKLIKNYRIYGNSIQNNLPDEYQEVEYIESTGTQYIDTKVSQSPNLKWIADMQFLESANDNNYHGTMLSDSRFVFGVYKGLNVYGTSHYNTTNTNADYQRHIYKLYGNGIFYIDDLKYIDENPTKTNSQGIPLFARKCSDNTIDAYSNARIYNTKFYNDDTLVRNMIPCYRKSDNEIGLYDLVNNVFYTNEGTGTFTKGNDITPTPDTPVEVESVGDLVTDESDENYRKYKIPVKVNDNVTNIYLNEPLRKIGDYLDYIDFKNQKVVRNVDVVDDTGTLTIEESYQGLATPTEETIELPTIPTNEGTKIIEVDTTISPSRIDIEYLK